MKFSKKIIIIRKLMKFCILHPHLSLSSAFVQSSLTSVQTQNVPWRENCPWGVKSRVWCLGFTGLGRKSGRILALKNNRICQSQLCLPWPLIFYHVSGQLPVELHWVKSTVKTMYWWIKRVYFSYNWTYRHFYFSLVGHREKTSLVGWLV